MAREIAEQPATIEATVNRLRPLAEEIRALVGDRRRVILIARGTSDNAALYGQYLLALRAGVLAVPASPSLSALYRAEVDLSDTVAVAISQSGGTEEIVEAMHDAKQRGARTIAVTNGADSPLARDADLALVTAAGRELAVPATKTYSAQLVAVAVLALAIGQERRLLDQLDDVPEAVSRMLGTEDAAAALADRLRDVERMVVTARGLALTTARELALKLQETCHLAAVGLSGADLQHGPIAMLDARTPALLVASATDSAVAPGMVELARRCRASGADVHVLGGDDALGALADVRVAGPDLPPELAPIPLIVPGQLLTLALARAKGLDPDTPRGLNKVTQTA
ncbi:hypothetical protein N867_02330 [Actinotalea fermentans ATCC 43279 = JCM 9966 = DSM 3133]|nr:hypothetical protein N867_02330 [Actinotalea fermentans ATCC 43279 = JCM 9966 = DSM 3133]